MSKKRSSLPWQRSYHGHIVAVNGSHIITAANNPLDASQDDEDLDFIVRAVNAHEELVEQLKNMVAHHRYNCGDSTDDCPQCQDALSALKRVGV